MAWATANRLLPAAGEDGQEAPGQQGVQHLGPYVDARVRVLQEAAVSSGQGHARSRDRAGGSSSPPGGRTSTTRAPARARAGPSNRAETSAPQTTQVSPWRSSRAGRTDRAALAGEAGSSRWIRSYSWRKACTYSTSVGVSIYSMPRFWRVSRPFPVRQEDRGARTVQHRPADGLPPVEDDLGGTALLLHVGGDLPADGQGVLLAAVLLGEVDPVAPLPGGLPQVVAAVEGLLAGAAEDDGHIPAGVLPPAPSGTGSRRTGGCGRSPQWPGRCRRRWRTPPSAPGTRARTRPSYTAQSGMCRASHTAMTPRAFSTLNSPGMVSRNSRS